MIARSTDNVTSPFTQQIFITVLIHVRYVTDRQVREDDPWEQRDQAFDQREDPHYSPEFGDFTSHVDELWEG